MRPLFAVTLTAAVCWMGYYAASRLANNGRKMRRAFRPTLHHVAIIADFPGYLKHRLDTITETRWVTLSDIERELGK